MNAKVRFMKGDQYSRIEYLCNIDQRMPLEKLHIDDLVVVKTPFKLEFGVVTDISETGKNDYKYTLLTVVPDPDQVIL